MVLLDLFCGAGGASMGYHRAGFDEIWGVDWVDQPYYPFNFVKGNVFDFVQTFEIREFDLIHASPPCQQFTRYRNYGPKVGATAPNFIPQTRELLQRSGRPYVIENVFGAPLLDPILLCGTAFGLDLRRHRLFESNFPIPDVPCAHENQSVSVEIGGDSPMSAQRKAMDIYWMPRRALSQAIPPAFTEHIGKAYHGIYGRSLETT